MKTVCSLTVFAVCAACLAGCHKTAEILVEPPPLAKNYEAQLPPGQLALRKITDPREIPDFRAACADTAGLREAVACSLDYLAKPSSQQRFPYGDITHAQAVESLKTFQALVDSGMPPEQMNESLVRLFDVYTSVGCDNAGTVLFTCYYTPIFDASPVQTGRFRYPLYKSPPGLVKNADGTPQQPMPDRRTIETSGMFAGYELVWLGDAFEAYVAQIQGSCRLRMPDGQERTIGYTANNGHEYHSIRAELAADGKIGIRDGLPAMLAYFRAHPEDITRYTWRNPRYVFFAPIDDGRPRGCLNEPVTPRRSVATDKTIFPPACLALVATRLPQRQGGTVNDVSYAGFALDQDSGGAIRAAGRCDVYLGIGPEAGELAGRAQNEGRLYYLFLKPSAGAPPALVPAAAPPAN